MNTTAPSVQTEVPEMHAISPTVSHSSDDLDASNTSSISTAGEDLATPPHSPTADSGPSSWITYDPKSGDRVYNFPSLNKKSKSKPKASAAKPTELDWSSAHQKFNFPSLNKEKKQTSESALLSSSMPKFDFTLSSIPSPPSKKPTNAYTAATTPYTRSGATLAVVGMRRDTNTVQPLQPVQSKAASSDRPHVSMPKSQPLSRALFSKLTENTPGTGRKLNKKEKLIEPKKEFKTVFELPLTSSEFARRM
jgi:hypothetical protein